VLREVRKAVQMSLSEEELYLIADATKYVIMQNVGYVKREL
jgi:hypothetical protein